MHPAPSIIFFTTLSGAGYGLLLLLGLIAPGTPGAPTANTSLIGLVIGSGLVMAGLISSTLHLRHPERAWRALTQWRSSWLSREGVAALLTFIPIALFGASLLGLLPRHYADVLGLIVALGAAITIACTAMIYASLRTIRQWHNPLVLPLYLGLALATGGQILTALLLCTTTPSARAMLIVTLILTFVVWLLKLAYWRRLSDSPAATRASALGLPPGSQATPLFDPNTEDNYLLKEMAYHIGRKHRRKLRLLAVVIGAILPIVLLLLALLLPTILAALAAAASAVCGLSGVLIERWLFFAEATHTVTHYYRQGPA